MNRFYFAFVVLAFSACRPSNPPTQTSVSGTAVLIAPIVNAHVRATLIGPNNSADVVGEGVTNEKGQFNLPLFASEGTVLIEVLGDQGGTTQEPISNKTLGLSLTDRFSTIVSGLRLGDQVEGVVISPWSHLIATHATWNVKTNHRTYSQALVEAAQLFTQHFGDHVIFGDLPIDPSAAAIGISAGALHGFATTALALVGTDLSHRLRLKESGVINTLSLSQWLAQDLSDGVFDGRDSHGPINIFEDQNVDREFTRSSLGAAMGTYLTSSANKSGISLSDLTPIITAVSVDNSVLYGSNSTTSAGATAGGIDGPAITLVKPERDVTLKDQVVVIGEATSSKGVAGVEMFLDDQLFGDGGQRISTTKIGFSQTLPLNDGFHSLVVKATDATGGRSMLTVNFSSDKTPPKLDFAYCQASNDEKRNYPPTINYDTGKIDWREPTVDLNCIQTALQKTSKPDVYTFTTFTELAKDLNTSSLIGVVPTDVGPVSTPNKDIVLMAAIYRNNQLIGHATTIPSKSPTDASRDIFISSSLFGPELLNVSATDLLELRLTASDAEINETTVSYYFHFNPLPTPLGIVLDDLPTGAPERLDSNVLRTALKHAGIVLGYEHVCRRKNCGYREVDQSENIRRCPKDGMKLWPKAKVRPIRFHDLRHTTATLLIEERAPIAAVQKIMRHSDPSVTMRIYAHPEDEWLNEFADRLSFNTSSEGSFAAHLLHDPKTTQTASQEDNKMLLDINMLNGGVDGTRTRGLRRDRPAL